MKPDSIPPTELALRLLRPKEGSAYTTNLQDKIKYIQQQQVAAVAIIAVCHITGISPERITKHTRKPEVIDAKFVLVALLREKTKFTEEEIAKMLCVTHPAINNATRKSGDYKANDKKFAAIYQQALQLFTTIMLLPMCPPNTTKRVSRTLKNYHLL